MSMESSNFNETMTSNPNVSFTSYDDQDLSCLLDAEEEEMAVE